jgi:hypothetical protein
MMMLNSFPLKPWIIRPRWWDRVAQFVSSSGEPAIDDNVKGAGTCKLVSDLTTHVRSVPRHEPSILSWPANSRAFDK